MLCVVPLASTENNVYIEALQSQISGRLNEMTKIKETLLDPTKRVQVIGDCSQMVSDEVNGKRGLTGLAVKAAFKAVRAFKPNIIESVMEALLDDFAAQLEPFYSDYLKSGESDLKRYLCQRDGEIADSLLMITDGRAKRSKLKTLVKAYEKLRPQGRKHVAEAVPGIAKLLQKYGL